MQNSSENITLNINQLAFNFTKKKEYQFCANTLVNDDFCNYLKFISKRDCQSMLYLMQKMKNKERIFYRDIDYTLFYKLIGKFNLLRNFYFNSKYPKHTKINDVNEYSLSLLPISESENIIYLTIAENRYRYEANELLTIYKYSLNSVDENFYLSRELISPKNPYTNVEFTLKQNLTIFLQLKSYLYNKNKHLPSYLIQFKECYFNLRLYKRLNINRLSLVSVNKYVDIMPREDFKAEFNDMVQNENIKEIYCRHCYKKYDIYKIFKKTMVQYILNSNDIYVFGYYVMDFIKTAKVNNLIFDESHRNFHKMRNRRQRTLNRSNRNQRRRLSNTPETIINNGEPTNITGSDTNILSLPDFPTLRPLNSLSIRIPSPQSNQSDNLSRLPPINFIFEPIRETTDNNLISNVVQSVVDNLINETVSRISLNNLNRENTISNYILTSTNSNGYITNRYTSNSDTNTVAELSDFKDVDETIKNKDYDESYSVSIDSSDIESDEEKINYSEVVNDINNRLINIENRLSTTIL